MLRGIEVSISFSFNFSFRFRFSFFAEQYISDPRISERAYAPTGVDVADTGILFWSCASVRCTKGLGMCVLEQI